MNIKEISMRNILFTLTPQQIKDRSKTVTRRIGWQFLKVGDVLMACDKGFDLKQGEVVVQLGRIEVISILRERLHSLDFNKSYGAREAKKEGFPEMSGSQFLAFFCRKMEVDPTQIVTRIEFKYLD